MQQNNTLLSWRNVSCIFFFFFLYCIWNYASRSKCGAYLLMLFHFIHVAKFPRMCAFFNGPVKFSFRIAATKIAHTSKRALTKSCAIDTIMMKISTKSLCSLLQTFLFKAPKGRRNILLFPACIEPKVYRRVAEWNSLNNVSNDQI